MAFVARPRGSRDPGPGAAPGEAAGITGSKRVLDRTAAQSRRSTPDLYPLERWCHCRLWKALPSRVPRCHDPRRVGSEFPCRQADGEAASDAVVAPRREYADAGSNCRGKWRTSRSVTSTVPTAGTQRASNIQAKAAPSAGCLTPEKLPVSNGTVVLRRFEGPLLRILTSNLHFQRMAGVRP